MIRALLTILAAAIALVVIRLRRDAEQWRRWDAGASSDQWTTRPPAPHSRYRTLSDGIIECLDCGARGPGVAPEPPGRADAPGPRPRVWVGPDGARWVEVISPTGHAFRDAPGPRPVGEMGGTW